MKPGVFAAALAGGAVKPLRSAAKATADRGLAVSDDEFTLHVARRTARQGKHHHPTESRDGTWRVPLTLHEPGSYRVFADFAVDGKPHTLADDLSTAGVAESPACVGYAASVATLGARLGQLGSHQFASPSSRISAGTSNARITVASRMIPAASPIASGLIS